MSINDFKPNPDDITSIDGIDISEGCSPSNVNDAVRHVMSNLHDLVNKTDVTQSTSGYMSAADKTKLDSIDKATQLPKESGTATIGTSNKYATEDHVHPLQTSVTGNAGTATKLQTARTIAISDGAISTPISFDGSSDITLPVTQLDSGKLQHLKLADTGTSYIKTLYDVCMNAWIGITAADSIGALKITLPVSWSTTFFSFDIELIKLSSPDYNSRIHIEAYSYGANSRWLGEQCDQLGKNYRVRLGHDGEKCCILIGDTAHTWNDFVVIVHKVTCGYHGYSSITRDGWLIDILKNDSTITAITEPIVNKNTTANKLVTARTISLTGDVTGSTSFDGSGNVSLTTVVADDSHNHIIDNIDNLQTTLNNKAPLLSPALIGTPTAPTANVGTNTNQIATTEFVASTVNNVSLTVTKSESLPNTRAEILAKNTDFTVPSYKVGSNTLMVFINGVHGMAGEDATLYAYKEMGTVGTMSTTIQFHDDIATDHSIFAIVFGLNI